MRLTQEQIQQIDKYLKEGGIKYWDVRLEMVDHIACDIFKNAKTNDFKLELDEALSRVNWAKNLEEIHVQSWKNTNKLYRKMYYKEIVFVFKSLQKTLLFLLCIGLYALTAKNLSLDTFVKLSYFIFITPVVFTLSECVRALILKLGRSVHLEYGLSYLMMNFLILQMFPLLFKDTTNSTQLIVWLIIMPIYFLTSYAGYKTFKIARDKTIVMKNLLKI